MLSSDNPHSPRATLGMDAQPANSSWSPRPRQRPRQRGFCRLLCCRPSSSCTPSSCILSSYRCLELRRAFPTDTCFRFVVFLLSFFLSCIGHPLSLVRVVRFLFLHPCSPCSRCIIDDEGLLVEFWPSFCLLSLSNVQHLTYTHTHTPTKTYPHTYTPPYRIATFQFMCS
ncbi:hypothetical protein BJ912DRAFT_955189, partial [Pholiota molesta]